jgi:2'-5' RNA ligase
VPRREDEADAVDTIRAFIAVELDAAARAAVARVIRALQGAPGAERVRWVRPENLHMTLRFLGNVASERVPTVVQCVGAAITSLRPFELRLGPVMLFPSLRRPRVLAMKVGPVGPLTQLAETVEAAVVRAGFAAEVRGFRPHLTLGRLDVRAIPAVTAPVTAEGEAVAVEEIVLFRSELTRRGALHTPLVRIALGGSDHP